MKNLALMAEISTNSPAKPVIEFLDEYGLERFTELSASDLSDPKVHLLYIYRVGGR